MIVRIQLWCFLFRLSKLRLWKTTSSSRASPRLLSFILYSTSIILCSVERGNWERTWEIWASRRNRYPKQHWSGTYTVIRTRHCSCVSLVLLTDYTHTWTFYSCTVCACVEEALWGSFAWHVKLHSSNSGFKADIDTLLSGVLCNCCWRNI